MLNLCYVKYIQKVVIGKNLLTMMRFRLSTIVGMILIICGASIVGRVVKVISLNKSLNSEEIVVSHVDNSSYIPDTKFSTIRKSNNQPKVISNSIDHIIWFVQISDLHLSIFHDKQRIYQFQEFVDNTLDIIQPPVVLVSGDLTDAKMRDNLGSKQYVDEWKIYQDILKKSHVTEKTIWLDIRGNHDNFDVPSLKSSNNYYQQYSIQGKHHLRSYMYTYKNGQDSVSFIAVDACLLPGPRRPFNFIGVLTAKELEALESFKDQSSSSNYTIWFGHYPTSCIISPDHGIRHLMKGGLAYLCGHLHTFHGFVENMYTRQQTGSLELELGDWKDNRLFRVAAIDHGMFSFVDVRMNEWPIMIITNPKNALFASPMNEPLHLISKSTHVRVLIWSDSAIIGVQMRFDESSSWIAMDHVEGPLFTASWDPKLFNEGIHMIEVSAADARGRKKVVTQPFSMDGSQPDFRLLNRIILMSNISAVFQCLFGLSIALYVIPLCVLRCVYYLMKEKKMSKPRSSYWLIRIWIRKLWILCTIDMLFWPLVLSCIYLPLGPWFIGEVLEDHVGVVFAWGTFVYSSYLPGSLTYAYGFLQMVFYQFPLVILSAHSADLRYQNLFMKTKISSFTKWFKQFSFFFLVISQAFNAYFFFLAYGTMALILGPLRTWTAFFGLYLWYWSSHLEIKDLRVAAALWGSKALTNEAKNDFSKNVAERTPHLSKNADAKESISSNLLTQDGPSTSL